MRITLRGQEYGTYPLNEDRRIEITGQGHTNIVQIFDSQVRMDHSDCKNQVCVETGAISRRGQTIVCLPNRVAVEIIGTQEEGGADDQIDAIVK